MAPGHFDGTLLQHVQSRRAVGQTYGQRALVLGATQPVPYIGTSSSTLAKERPFTRLAATAEAFETIFFGTCEEADRVLAGVHHMHRRVRGELPRQEGRFPAGTPYDAFDPELMLWTMGVLADSSRTCFEALVRPLQSEEREELWQDWVRFGELFGMPRSVAPATSRDFEEWMRDKVQGPDFHVTEEARVVGRAIPTAMPVPARVRLGSRGTGMVVVGLLPARVREAFGFRWTPAHHKAHTALTASVRASQRVLPARVVTGRNTRLFRLVSATEREIVARGGRTMELPET